MMNFFRNLALVALACSTLHIDLAVADDASPAIADAAINEWRSYREDELRQLERRRADAKTYSKFSDGTLRELAPAITSASASTVELLDSLGGRFCYGIVVDPAGYILTKASEVATAGPSLRCRFPGGITIGAQVSDMFPPYDLALVKVNATGLTSANWELAASEAPGTIVIAAGTAEIPISYGVLSVRSRMLNPGFLGVALARDEYQARIVGILPESGALAAGIRSGDVITEVEGKPITGRKELIETIKRYSLGEKIKVALTRQGAKLEVMVQLGSRLASTNDPNREMLEKMDVKLSAHRIDFPSALEHDLPLHPNQCGGPLVNLDGQLIGMNIARAGRIRSLAIPTADLAPLLNATTEGRFSIPDPEALTHQLDGARQAVARARQILESAEAKATNLERALENLKKYRLPQQMKPTESGENENANDMPSSTPAP
ncbi:MAG: serine protease Do [Verrucomicrobiales bacterium]|jgi:serine protease Do